MIGGGENDDIAWQLVELHQEKRNDALDFAGLMRVAALFSDGVEFIEKENAGACANVIEKPSETGIGLTKIASDQTIVANYKEGKRESFSNRFGEGCFSVAGWPRQKDAMARFIAMRSQHVGADMLFNELTAVFLNGQRKDQIAEAGAGFELQDRLFP
jgi:hypothetical protein